MIQIGEAKSFLSAVLVTTGHIDVSTSCMHDNNLKTDTEPENLPSF